MSLTGFTQACTSRSSAGVKRIGFVSVNDITGITMDTSDTSAIAAITLASGASFKKYQFMEDECEYQENVSRENGATAVTQNLIYKLACLNADTRKAVEEIMTESECGLVAVVEMKGRAIIVGYDADMAGERPLRISSTTGTTGKALTDATGEEITLTRTTTVKAHYYVGTVDSLFVAASAS